MESLGRETVMSFSEESAGKTEDHAGILKKSTGFVDKNLKKTDTKSF